MLAAASRFQVSLQGPSRSLVEHARHPDDRSLDLNLATLDIGFPHPFLLYRSFKSSDSRVRLEIQVRQVFLVSAYAIRE